jgi:hypothetical protein
MSQHECSICGYEYKTQEDAMRCSAKGTKPHELAIGDRISLSFCGGIILEVIELLTASHVDHDPGVRLKLSQGDMSCMYLGPSTDEAIMDEETAKKHLIRD